MIKKIFISFVIFATILAFFTVSFGAYNGYTDILQKPLNDGSLIESHKSRIPEFNDPNYQYYVVWVYGPRAYYIVFLENAKNVDLWLSTDGFTYEGNSYFSINSSVELHQKAYRCRYGSILLEADNVTTNFVGPTAVASNNQITFEYEGQLSIYKDSTKSSFFLRVMQTYQVQKVTEVGQLPVMVTTIVKIVLPVGLAIFGVGLVIFLIRSVVSRMQ